MAGFNHQAGLTGAILAVAVGYSYLQRNPSEPVDFGKRAMSLPVGTILKLASDTTFCLPGDTFRKAFSALQRHEGKSQSWDWFKPDSHDARLKAGRKVIAKAVADGSCQIIGEGEKVVIMESGDVVTIAHESERDLLFHPQLADVLIAEKDNMAAAAGTPAN